MKLVSWFLVSQWLSPESSCAVCGAVSWLHFLQGREGHAVSEQKVQTGPACSCGDVSGLHFSPLPEIASMSLCGSVDTLCSVPSFCLETETLGLLQKDVAGSFHRAPWPEPWRGRRPGTLCLPTAHLAQVCAAAFFSF